jgi:hypothetical protein
MDTKVAPPHSMRGWRLAGRRRHGVVRLRFPSHAVSPRRRGTLGAAPARRSAAEALRVAVASSVSGAGYACVRGLADFSTQMGRGSAPPSLDARLAALAEQQHSVVSLAQLLDLGFGLKGNRLEAEMRDVRDAKVDDPALLDRAAGPPLVLLAAATGHRPRLGSRAAALVSQQPRRLVTGN